MAYRNREITIDLDDIGEGCFVTIRNPQLLPKTFFEGAETVQLGPDGTPANPEEAAKAERLGIDVLGRLVTAWCVWDVNDDSVELPLPGKDPTVWDRAPVEVLKRLNEEVSQRANPQ